MIIFSQINYLAVIASMVAGFVLGMIWYAPFLFGNAWMKALGKTKETIGNPTVPMIGGAITGLIGALVMEVLIFALGIITISQAVIFGLLIGVGLIALNMLSDYLYSGWSLKLFYITAGYRIAATVVMAVVLVLFK